MQRSRISSAFFVLTDKQVSVVVAYQGSDHYPRCNYWGFVHNLVAPRMPPVIIGCRTTLLLADLVGKPALCDTSVLRWRPSHKLSDWCSRRRQMPVRYAIHLQ